LRLVGKSPGLRVSFSELPHCHRHSQFARQVGRKFIHKKKEK
jgi:hypothetical protein